MRCPNKHQAINIILPVNHPTNPSKPLLRAKCGSNKTSTPLPSHGLYLVRIQTLSKSISKLHSRAREGLGRDEQRKRDWNC